MTVQRDETPTFTEPGPAIGVGHPYPGTDAVTRHVRVGHRRTPGVGGQCALCLEAGNLRLGHIVPKWAHRMLSPGLSYNTVGGRSHYYRAQDGDKEYLLCSDCEQRLGHGENYLAALCRGRHEELAKVGIEIEAGGRLHGVDPGLVMRALLGIAFKAHFAEGEPFRHLDLGDLATEIRGRLQTDDYPTDLFDTHAVKWLDLRGSGILPRDVIEVSASRSRHGLRVHTYIGGVLFIQTLGGATSGARPLTSQLEGALCRGRPWWWLIGDVTDNMALPERLTRRFKRLPPAKAGPFGVAPSAPCPCGLLPRRRYADCCQLIWYYITPRDPVVNAHPNHRCEIGAGRRPCRLVLPPS